MDSLICLTTDLTRWVPSNKPDTKHWLKSHWLAGDRAGMSNLIHKGAGWLDVFIWQSRSHMCLSIKDQDQLINWCNQLWPLIFKRGWNEKPHRIRLETPANFWPTIFSWIYIHLFGWCVLIQSNLQSSPGHWHRQNANLRSPDNTANTLHGCPHLKALE